MCNPRHAFLLASLLAFCGGAVLADEYQAEASLRPRRAFAADGSYVEVTNDREHIRAVRYDAQGTTIGDVVIVDKEVKTKNTGRPELKNHSVAMDTKGNFLVAWEAANDFHEVHFRLFNKSGQVVAEFNSNNRLRPAVSMGSDGKFLLTYKDFLSRGRIVGELFDAKGERASGPFFVSTVGNRAWGSASAFGDDGRIAVAFEERSPDATRIRAAVLKAAGGTVRPLFEVGVSSDRKINAKSPSVAVGPKGEIAVAWEEVSILKTGDSGAEEVRKDVMLAVVDVKGEVLRAAGPVNQSALRFRDINPKVKFDGSGHVVVSYSAHGGDALEPDAVE